MAWRIEMEVLKQQLLRDPNHANHTWNILEHAINDILTHQRFGAVSFEDLYRHASDMMVHNFGEKLYSGLVTTMTSHLSGISKLIEDAQGELFLEELNRRWADHNEGLQMILDILVHMERSFIPWTHKTPIRELGFNLWRDIVMPPTTLRDTLLELVRRESNGEVINRELMRNIIKMLTDLGSSVYEEDLEQPFLEVSADFNRLKSQQFIESCDYRDYLKAERCLNEDIERVSHYLDPRSLDKIDKLVEKEMIEKHMHRLFQIENMALVDQIVNDKYEDLGMQFNLFCGVPTGLSIVRDVNFYIWDTGKQLATNLERLKDPVDFVQHLLDLDNLTKSSVWHLTMVIISRML